MLPSEVPSSCGSVRRQAHDFAADRRQLFVLLGRVAQLPYREREPSSGAAAGR